MTQADLFTPDSPDEIQYAESMAALVKAEQEYFIENGIIPNYVEADFLLSRDERRLLELVDQSAGYVIRHNDMVANPYAAPDPDSLFPDMQPERLVSRYTCDMQMLAEANSKAVLNAAIERGLVTVTQDGADKRIDMAKLGRYYLEMVSDNEWWESDEATD